MTTIISGSNGLTFPDSSTQAVGFYGFKNRIINGGMVIDQRNAGASTTPATGGTYTVDRWFSGMSQASKYSVQQTPSATESGYATRVAAGFKNYLAVTSLAATSLGATDYFIQGQSIEGFNVADLAWGTSSAKTVTLSFWVYSSLTGTFGGSLQNGGQTRHYPFSYTINSASTWEQKSITIAGDQTGTWATDNSKGIQLNFGLGVGTTYSGTAGSWSGTYALSATGATSVVGTNGATFYITGVQLEKGSTATSFDYRPYGTELMLCQRYFYSLDLGTTTSQSGPAGYADTTTSAFTICNFPVTMRVAPSSMTTSGTASDYGVRIAGGSTVSFNAVPTLSNPTTTTALIIGAVASGLTAGGGLFIRGLNAANRYLGFNAEL